MLLKRLVWELLTLMSVKISPFPPDLSISASLQPPAFSRQLCLVQSPAECIDLLEQFSFSCLCLTSLTMRVLFLLLALALLASQCIEARTLPIRKPSMPKTPRDPTPAKGDGSGKYKAKAPPKLSDRIIYIMARAMVAAGKKVKKRNAAKYLDHYLDNNGKTLKVNPAAIINASPWVRKVVQSDAIAEGQKAFRKIKGKTGYKTFTYDWGVTGAETHSDWFYAIGDFSYSISGIVTKTGKNQGKLEYVVDVYDIYNWNKGTWLKIGGKKIGVDKLGRLHATGLARDYKVRGRSGRFTIIDLMTCPRSSVMWTRALKKSKACSIKPL